MSLDSPLSVTDLTHLIGPRLPDWLAQAPAADVSELHALCNRAEVSRRALQVCAEKLPHFNAYALQALAPLLATLGEPDLDPQATLLYWTSPEDDTAPVTCTLLQAALRNFTEEDVNEERYGAGSGVFHGLLDDLSSPDRDRPVAFTPWAFAAACRQADIGAGFATVLASQVPCALAADTTAPCGSLPEAFASADRDALAAEAFIARLKGAIDAEGQALLVNAGVLPGLPDAAHSASAKRLTIAGFELDRVLLVIGDRNGPRGRPCVLYVPNDPHTPVSQFDNLDALIADLERRVHHPAYLRFLASYVGLQQQAAFVRAVEGPPPDEFERLFAIAVNPLNALQLAIRLIRHQRPFPVQRLKVNLLPLGDVFTERYASWRAQLLSDASVLATPTERLDRLAAQARHARWIDLGEQLGLFVLSCIPGVGQVVAVYSMVQVLHTVFDVSHALLEGDERRARTLLLGSVENAGYFMALQHQPDAVAAQGLAERLKLMADEQGGSRLWVPDMHLLGSTSLPVEQGMLPPEGLLRAGQRAWVRLNDRYVEVEPDATPWVARPLMPSTYQGRVARLLSNGYGGWRAEYENPATWQGTTLIRRSGTEAIGLDDTAVELACELAGVEEVSLQERALTGQPLPGLLRYYLRRRANLQRLEQANAALTSHARLPFAQPEVVQTLVEVPGWPSSIGIELVTENGQTHNLHPQAMAWVRLTAQGLATGAWVSDILAQLSTETLAPLVAPWGAVDALEQGLARRWVSVLESRQEALVHRLSEDSTPSAATRLLIRQFPSLPSSVAADLVALCDGRQLAVLSQGRVPLPLAELAADSQRHLRVSRACEDLHDGRMTPDSRALLEGLPARVATPPQSTAAVYWASPINRVRLARLALSRRGDVRQLLGMVADTQVFFRMPTRLLDGRAGYLLSGRGTGRPSTRRPADAIGRRLLELYTGADDRTLATLREEVGEGAAALEALSQRERERNDLFTALMGWRHSGSRRNPAGISTVEALNLAVNTIMRTWRRDFVSVGAQVSDGPVRHVLNLSFLVIGEDFPSLPVPFAHVLEVQLSSMGLERVSSNFLEQFPNARLLSLEDNPLSELPRGPQWLTRLRGVGLGNIGPRCTGDVMGWLALSAQTLEYLGLENNPTIPSDRLLNGLAPLTHLTHLDLSDNAIVLTSETEGSFVRLTRLQTLSLDHNPLTLPPRVNGLNQLTSLSLADTNIAELPPGLVQLMDTAPSLMAVDLSHNHIIRLPDLSPTRFFRRALRSLSEPGEARLELDLSVNPLDDDAIAQLQNGGFDYQPLSGANDNTPVPMNERWLIDCPPALQTLIRADMQVPAAGPFYEVLSQIVRTAPYVRSRNAAARQEVARRAWDIAALFLSPGEMPLPGTTELRERLYEMATDAQATCGDGIVLTLDQFEGEIAVWRAMASSTASDAEGPLREAAVAGRRLFRQALLDAQAQRLVRARLARQAGEVPADPATDLGDDLAEDQLNMGIDEVEVRLVLRRRLQAALDLPPVSDRLYEALVSEPTGERIAERVRALDTADAFANWLVAHQATWRSAIQRLNGHALEQLRAPYHEAIDYVLDLAAGEQSVHGVSPETLEVLETVDPEVEWQDREGTLTRPPLNEHQAQILVNRLRDRCTQMADALVLRLTRQLID
jgi:hypothetical protein